jgi:hypothetical protein
MDGKSRERTHPAGGMVAWSVVVVTGSGVVGVGPVVVVIELVVVVTVLVVVVTQPVPVTLTSKRHSLVSPHSSVALHVTAVVPTGNVPPLRVAVTVGLSATQPEDVRSPHESKAAMPPPNGPWDRLKDTVAAHCPGALWAMMAS